MLAGLVIYSLSAVVSTSGSIGGVILAFLGWITRMILTKRFEAKGVALNWPIVTLLVVLLVSTLISPLPLFQGLDKIRSLGEKILLYYLVIYGMRSKQDIKWLLFCLITSLCLLSGYEIVSLMWHFSPEKYLVLTSNRGTGGGLGMVIPLVVALIFLIPLSWRIKKGLIISLVVMAICLILTSTRGAWLGNICALTFLGLFISRRILLGLGIVIIISLLFLPDQQKHRAVNMLNLQTNADRVCLWQNALVMIKKRPFLGHGPGGYQVFSPKYAPEGKEKFSFLLGQKHAHNIFLQLAVEAGIVGLLALSWLLVSAFRWAWIVFKEAETSFSKILALGILACLIDFLVHGMVDYTLSGQTGYLFWFYLGFLTWLGKNQRST